MAKINWNENKGWFELIVDGKPLSVVSENKKAMTLLADEMGYELEGDDDGLHV